MLIALKGVTVLHAPKLKMLPVFNHTENGGDEESQLQINFYKMREGKPPFNNAEENQPRRVAEIFTVRAFMKLNSSKFGSNAAYFSEK